MKSPLKVFVAFALLSNALCFNLGRLFGLRKDWRDLSSQPADPQIVEVVRWRQSVCIVPSPGVPPCLMALRKHQDEYERNSAKGIEANQPGNLIVDEHDQVKNLNRITAASDNNNDFINYCSDLLFLGREDEICNDIPWYQNALKTKNVELEKPSNIAGIQNEFEKTADYDFDSNMHVLVNQYCTQKRVNANSKDSNSDIAKLSIEFLKSLKEFGILKEGDSIDLDSICDNFEFSPKILSPQVVDSVQVESVDRVDLDGSESSARSNAHHSVTLNLRSSTPGMEEARVHRQGRYLLIAEDVKSAPTARSPPAIYVTKVLNSPVTATLVAHNCFPDIGVPLCDEYQETLTINDEPDSPWAQPYQALPESATVADDLSESTEQVIDPSEEENTEGDIPESSEPSAPESTEENVPENTEESVQENTEASDFWDDPTNPHFDDGTDKDESQRPYGLWGQAVQHVLSKPGVISAIPPEVIEAIANNPAILEALANAGNPEGSPIDVTQIKPQIVTSTESGETVVTTTTSKPGFISSLLDGHRPAILDHFWYPAFNIFNKSTTAKPETTVTEKPHGSFGDGLLGHANGQKPVIEAIQNLINKPQIVNTIDEPSFQPVLVIEPTKRPGLFQHLWNPAGGLGLFDKRSTTTVKPSTTEEPNVFNSEIDGGEEPKPKPTQAPGFFGGLLSNPSRPIGFGSSIFSRPTNKPLIIKRPGAKPLLVERPIYIQEKPPQSAGLLSFFLPAGNKPLLNVDHEVIKEPVYVYQKPQTAAGILSNIFGKDTVPSKPGFFQGWAIFGNHQNKPVVEKPSNDKTKKASQNGASTEASIEQSEDQIATVDDIPEEVAALQTASEPSVPVENIADETAALQTPSESVVPVEEIAKEIAALQTPSKSTIPVEDIEEEIEVTEDKAAVDGENTTSLSNISDLHAVEDKPKNAETAVEAILEDTENNFAHTSATAAEETKVTNEESVIDNEA